MFTEDGKYVSFKYHSNVIAFQVLVPLVVLDIETDPNVVPLSMQSWIYPQLRKYNLVVDSVHYVAYLRCLRDSMK